MDSSRINHVPERRRERPSQLWLLRAKNSTFLSDDKAILIAGAPKTARRIPSGSSKIDLALARTHSRKIYGKLHARDPVLERANEVIYNLLILALYRGPAVDPFPSRV